MHLNWQMDNLNKGAILVESAVVRAMPAPPAFVNGGVPKQYAVPQYQAAVKMRFQAHSPKWINDMIYT